MVRPEDIQQYIEQGMPCDLIKVVGDGHHFEALIVSSEFRGKNRVQQHQRVYLALGDRLRAEIHALSMPCFPPEDWAARG